MIFTAANVAPLFEKPVDVLMKSALASKHISEAFIISFLFNSEISIITFKGVFPMANFTSLISFKTDT